MACAVKGCEEQASEVVLIERPGIPLLEWVVCGFHAQAIQAGETWSLGVDQNEILLGTQGPMAIVNMKVHTDVVGSVVTLELGHDGIKEQEVSFQMKPEEARSVCHWVGHGKHNYDGSLPDEGTNKEQ